VKIRLAGWGKLLALSGAKAGFERINLL